MFDEPTTDLDPLGKLEIFAVLAAMRRHGYTLVVIEHESAAAEQADRLIILSGGRIVADDTPERVLADVDFLDAHGVRPPDFSRARRAQWHLTPRRRSLDDRRSSAAQAVISDQWSVISHAQLGTQHAATQHSATR